MKKLLLLLIGMLLLTIVPQRIIAQESTSITWEAENGALESPVIRKSGSKTDKKPIKPGKNSGTGWIEIPNKANSEEIEGDRPGKAIFKVNVPVAGQYVFWARTLWPNGCGNSFWVRQANHPNQLLGEDGTYDIWQWRKLSNKMYLQKGINVIVVANREDGVLMDQCQITTGSIVPQGAIVPTQGALAK